MAVSALIPLGLLAGGLLYLASSDDDGPAPVEPPGPEGFTPGALESLTEVRMVDGQPVRYFRAEVAQAILGMLSESYPVPLSPAQSGIAAPNLAFQVLHASSVTPEGGSATALQAVQMSAQQGLSVLASLSVTIPTDTGDRWLAIVRPTDVAVLARDGSRWAVLLDPARGVGPGTPPPGPPGPGPGPYPPPPPPPPYGGGGDGGVAVDPHMPAELRAKVLAMLKDDDMEPAALEQFAAQIEGDYPIAAASLRDRANELRTLAKADAYAKGGFPFRIRSGDIPSRLAQYYTGDGTRWTEIPQANPGMQIVTINGVTQLKPWQGEILLPLPWEAWAKPLPPVASGTVPANEWPGPPYALPPSEVQMDPLVVSATAVGKKDPLVVSATAVGKKKTPRKRRAKRA